MERQDPQLDADRYRVTQPGAGAPGHRRRTGKTGGLNDLRGDRFLDNYRSLAACCSMSSDMAQPSHTGIIQLTDDALCLLQIAFDSLAAERLRAKNTLLAPVLTRLPFRRNILILHFNGPRFGSCFHCALVPSHRGAVTSGQTVRPSPPPPLSCHPRQRPLPTPEGGVDAATPRNARSRRARPWLRGRR